MAGILHSVRLILGVGMVSAGMIAAWPYAATLVTAYGRTQALEPAPETMDWVREAAEPRQAGDAAGLAQHGEAGHVTAGPAWIDPAIASDAADPSAPFVPRSGYRPPEPPGPMPPVAADLARATPAIAAAYRSTLDVPPPPLLDADTPPPLAVAWSAGARNARVARAAAPPPADTQAYVVRDGDDLTGIALKFYGHAGGAQAIWAVNRDRLSNPDLLPIGLELRIPPPWSVPAVQPEAGGAPVIEPGRRPGSVRVGPGETLESLAERFYGDRAMATRLFEANRDQLRSPALVVAGMELRLP